MATKKFKDCSPYEAASDRCHDVSDYKYTKFMNSFNNDKNLNNAATVVMALFGLGRAGSIHIANILANPRCVLKYIVEQDRSRWEQARTRWNLINTEFIHPDEAGKVYNDIEVNMRVLLWWMLMSQKSFEPRHQTKIDANVRIKIRYYLPFLNPLSFIKQGTKSKVPPPKQSGKK